MSRGQKRGRPLSRVAKRGRRFKIVPSLKEVKSVKQLPCFLHYCRSQYQRPASDIIEHSDRILPFPGNSPYYSKIRVCKVHSRQWQLFQKKDYSCQICKGMNGCDLKQFKDQDGTVLEICTNCAYRQQKVLNIENPPKGELKPLTI